MERYIDCETMTEKECYTEMLKKCYGGNIPVDAYDFGAGDIFTPCDAKNADYTLHFATDHLTNFLTDLPASAPMVNKQVKVPKKLRNTFQHSVELADSVTMLDDALKNFLEAVVYLEEYGKATTNLKKWFCRSWGLDYNINLDILRPSIPSRSDLAFSTVDADLDVDSYYNREGDIMIDVTDNGITRMNRFPNKSFNWVRGQAILRTLGNITRNETNQFNGKDWYYAIVDHNIPDIMGDFDWDDDLIVETVPNVVNKENNDYVQKLIDQEITVHMANMETDNLYMTYTPRYENLITAIPIVAATVRASLPLSECNPFEEFAKKYANEDIQELEMKPVPINKPIKVPEPHLLTDVKNFFKPVLEKVIDMEILKKHNFRSIKNMIDSKKIDNDVVNAIFSKHFIEALQFAERKYDPDIVKVYNPFIRTMKYFGLDRKDIGGRDIEKISRLGIINKHVRKMCAKLAYEYIISAYSDRYKNSVLEKEVFQVMKSKRSIYAGLDRFIVIRKNFWIKHFLDRSQNYKKKHFSLKKRSYKEKRIIYQLLAKFFRYGRITDKDSVNGRVTFELDRNKTVAALYAVAEQYKRHMITMSDIRKKEVKREKKPFIDLVRKCLAIPGPVGLTIMEYAQKLDIALGPEVKFVKVIKKVYEQGEFLAKDVASIFDKVELEVILNDISISSDEECYKEYVYVPVPVVKSSPFAALEEEIEEDIITIKAPVINPLASLEMDDDEDIIPVKKEVAIRLMNVDGIVKSLKLQYSDTILTQVIAKYGNQIAINKMDEVKEYARGLVPVLIAKFATESVKKIVQKGDDFDIK
jgi:hypothetical protein